VLQQTPDTGGTRQRLLKLVGTESEFNPPTPGHHQVLVGAQQKVEFCLDDAHMVSFLVNN
jgi:hypothetical protein